MGLLTSRGVVDICICVTLLIWATLRICKMWLKHAEYSGIYVLINQAWLATTISTGIFGWIYETALFLCIMTNIDLLHRAEARARQPVLGPVYERELVPVGD